MNSILQSEAAALTADLHWECDGEFMKKLSDETVEKIRKAESPEELMKTAERENYPLERKEATRIWEKYHINGELPDDDIENVSGGGCSSASDTDSFKGVWATGYELMSRCPVCGYNCWTEITAWGTAVRTYECSVCYRRKINNLPSAPSVVPVTKEPGQTYSKPRSQIYVKN